VFERVRVERCFGKATVQCQVRAHVVLTFFSMATLFFLSLFCLFSVSVLSLFLQVDEEEGTATAR
jgi:hypothetical protein